MLPRLKKRGAFLLHGEKKEKGGFIKGAAELT